VILGSSNFLYPHPVRAIADAVHRVPGAVLAYDASHVLGFLAAGRFQDPLGEGADVVFGSTHKTFPGPQGGIIFSNDDTLMDRVTPALVPALITNHHPFRMPALVVTLEEMATWGKAYAEAMVANARVLGRALAKRGVPVVEAGGRPTDSHTILLRVSSFGTSDDLSARLEAAGIMTTGAFLPESLGREGIRIGSQEVTRLGATADTMDRAAELIAEVLTGRRSPGDVRPAAAELARELGPVQYA
jgi:glycine hydroxymethyltransferase